MTAGVREPGGPQQPESVSGRFAIQLEIIRNNWGHDEAAVLEAQDSIQLLLDEIRENDGAPLLAARAGQWYETPLSVYGEGFIFSENSQTSDELLKFDRPGTNIAGEVLAVTTHEVHGSPGLGWYDDTFSGFTEANPKLPGLLVNNLNVRGGSPRVDSVAFVPFGYISQPELRVYNAELETVG